jgi:hypothetical protein
MRAFHSLFVCLDALRTCWLVILLETGVVTVHRLVGEAYLSLGGEAVMVAQLDPAAGVCFGFSCRLVPDFLLSALDLR